MLHILCGIGCCCKRQWQWPIGLPFAPFIGIFIYIVFLSKSSSFLFNRYIIYTIDASSGADEMMLHISDIHKLELI